MVLPTIFSAHAPAAQHRARRQAAGIAAPAVTLSPLDAFLLTRIAAFLPHPLTVIDFAAVATDGDSAAILHAAEIPVIAPQVERMTPMPRGDSRAAMRESRNGMHSGEAIAATVPLTTVQVRNAPVAAGMDDWDAVIRMLPRGETALVLLAETATTAAHTGEHLAWLAERVPDAPILLLPLGATGTGEVLAQAVHACPPGGTRRLVALREQAPFFATSELGLVFSADNAMMTVVLERLVAMMTGNFQFLPLVQDAVQAASHIAAIEAELTRVQATLAQVQVQVQAQVAQVQPEVASSPTEMVFEVARAHLERELAEKTRYAEWLESRLNHLEDEYIPWKNTVLTGLENEVRNLYASKMLRMERLLRRVLRRG